MEETARPAVATFTPGAAYGRAPFHPPEVFPETAFLGSATDPGNTAYSLVRESLACYDAAHLGTASWNPLGWIVQPGQHVVLKPNLVMHDRQGGGSALRTHGAVIRAVADYAIVALGGRGKLTICDAPIQGADFGRMVRQSGLDALVDFYRSAGLDFSLVDLRSEWAKIDDESGFIKERVELPGDPGGCTEFDLGRESALESVTTDDTTLAVGDYSSASTSANHRPGRHRYRFSNTVLGADVVLNVAKMKTHGKAGISGALKNVVGMNTSKDYLPHFRAGGPPAGDEFPPSSFNRVVAMGRGALQERVPLAVWRSLRFAAEAAGAALGRLRGGDPRYGLVGGSWAGNDTVWRMVADINRIAIYGGRDGRLHDAPKRKIYHFVDGVVAGEGEGPLRPMPRSLGLFIHGDDAPAIDALMSALMGFDPERIPQVGAISAGPYALGRYARLQDVPVTMNGRLSDRFAGGEHFGLRPSRGWNGLANTVPPALLRSLAERPAGEGRGARAAGETR